MKKRNYKFTAFNTNGNEIDLGVERFINITLDEARLIRMAIEIGLEQKYKCPRVIFKEV